MKTYTIYTFYYEYREKPENTWLNSNIVPCEGIEELKYKILEATQKKWENIIIATIQGARPRA